MTAAQRRSDARFWRAVAEDLERPDARFAGLCVYARWGVTKGNWTLSSTNRRATQMEYLRPCEAETFWWPKRTPERTLGALLLAAAIEAGDLDTPLDTPPAPVQE